MKESAIHAAVIDHWKACGLPQTLVATIPNAGAFGQAGLTRGLFDLLVIGGRIGVGFIEIKTPRGVKSEPQKAFQALLISNGVHHAITYGRDEPITVLEDWGIVRKQVRAAA